MVRAATSFSRSGVTDWLIQRFSAVILAIYVVLLLGFLMLSKSITFQSWQLFILSTPMKVFSVLALLSLLAHGWIGLWTVATDYIKNLSLRLLFHTLYSLVLVCMLIWGMNSLWF